MNNNLVQVQNNGKQVTVKFASGARPAEIFQVPPGATAAELLQQLGLGRDFCLSKGTPDSVFGMDEPLYPQIQDGDLLFVTSRVDAGCLL